MKRREFIRLVGGAAATWPAAARAQAGTPVIGLLGATEPPLMEERLSAFREGLAEIGFVEGRNVGIGYRWANSRFDRLPALASDLVRRQVDVIVAGTNIPAALAAKAATTTIPIVFQIGNDPVALGLVDSLNRPGRNLTGVTTLVGELAPKKLELLRELVPAATSFAVLLNPTSAISGETQLKDLQAAALTLGLQLHVLHASNEGELEPAITMVRELRAGGLVIGADNVFSSRGEQLGAITLRHAVPAVSQYRPFPSGGGLMSYGGSYTDPFRLVGVYAGRILRGEKPSDLPVQQSAKVELIINMKTARALGITVPLSLLGRADEVIE
jgi:putative ABC transport system substrate-binding protein